MEEKRVDLRIDNEENRTLVAEAKRSAQLCFRINHTMPMTEVVGGVLAKVLKMVK